MLNSSRRAYASALGVLLLLPSVSSAADKKKEEGGAADQAQSFDSPLPLVGGATIQISKGNTSASIAAAGQMSRLFNYWQFGVTGNANSEGEVQTYSEAEGVTAGLKAKVGFGYSSFLAEDTPDRDRQQEEFFAQARCVLMVQAARKELPKESRPTFDDDNSITTCKSELEKVGTGIAHAKGQGSLNAEAVKQFDQLMSVLNAATATPGMDASMNNACDQLEKVAYAFRYCDKSMKGFGTVGTLSRRFVKLYSGIVTAKGPGARFRLSANWIPQMFGVDYRPTTDGVPDLSKEENWKGLLNGGSLDFTWHHRELIFGLQAAYTEKLDEKETAPVSVCRTTTQGEFSYEKCKDAAIGKPSPFASATFGAVLGLDPLIPKLGESAFRPGLQITGRRETLKGDKYRWVLSGILYVAQIEAPMKLVVGIKPTYTWLRGAEKKDELKVSVFIGARQ